MVQQPTAWKKGVQILAGPKVQVEDRHDSFHGYMLSHYGCKTFGLSVGKIHISLVLLDESKASLDKASNEVIGSRKVSCRDFRMNDLLMTCILKIHLKSPRDNQFGE
jgi:hypothetical protein